MTTPAHRCTWKRGCTEPATVEVWKHGTLLHLLCERHAVQNAAAADAYQQRQERRALDGAQPDGNRRDGEPSGLARH